MKSKLVTFLLCTFLGNFGVHRFYLGKVGTGLLYLFTFGLCGIGTFVDIIKIASNTMKDKSGMDLNEDVPSAIVWTVAGFYIFLFVIGFWSGIFSESEKVVDNVPKVPSIETPVQKVEDVSTQEVEEIPIQKEEEKPVQNSYQKVSIKELTNALKENALRAEKTYQDMYVEVHGYIKNIDSDGKYISISDTSDDWDFTYVMCYIKNDDQLNKVMTLNRGSAVTIYGRIKSIGEVLGYSIDIVDMR